MDLHYPMLQYYTLYVYKEVPASPNPITGDERESSPKAVRLRGEQAMESVRSPYPNTTKAGGAQPVWWDSFKNSVYYQGLDLPGKKK